MGFQDHEQQQEDPPRIHCLNALLSGPWVSSVSLLPAGQQLTMMSLNALLSGPWVSSIDHGRFRGVASCLNALLSGPWVSRSFASCYRMALARICLNALLSGPWVSSRKVLYTTWPRLL